MGLLEIVCFPPGADQRLPWTFLFLTEFSNFLFSSQVKFQLDPEVQGSAANLFPQKQNSKKSSGKMSCTKLEQLNGGGGNYGDTGPDHATSNLKCKSFPLVDLLPLSLLLAHKGKPPIIKRKARNNNDMIRTILFFRHIIPHDLY